MSCQFSVCLLTHITAPDYEDETTSFDAAHRLSGAPSLTQDGYGDSADAVARKIEPRQNWLARLFRVKPSRGYLCLQMSRRRARQEVTILLREWRKWGIRDVEVDKERNIVFARVGKKNCEYTATDRFCYFGHPSSEGRHWLTQCLK